MTQSCSEISLINQYQYMLSISPYDIVKITDFLSISHCYQYQYQNQYCHFCLSIFPYQCIEQLCWQWVADEITIYNQIFIHTTGLLSACQLFRKSFRTIPTIDRLNLNGPRSGLFSTPTGHRAYWPICPLVVDTGANLF